jgi:hypothetical protein
MIAFSPTIDWLPLRDKHRAEGYLRIRANGHIATNNGGRSHERGFVNPRTPTAMLKQH